MKAFFFFHYELSGRLRPVRTHTLMLFTGKASIWTPGR